MKIYVNRSSMKLLAVDKERAFYTGDSYSSTLTVYFDEEPTNASVTLSFLLSNGRTPRKNLVPDEVGVTAYTTEVYGQTTWYYYTWELSTKEGILTSPGPLQMTLAVTVNDVVEQVNFVNNVVRTTLFGTNENIIVFGENPEDVILDFATNITSLNASISANATKLAQIENKLCYLGSYTDTTTMYADAFTEVYTNGHPLVTALFNNNLVLFLKSDNTNHSYLYYVNCVDYKVYKLATDGTLTEIYQRVDTIHALTARYADGIVSSLRQTVNTNAQECNNKYSAALQYVDDAIANLVGEAPEELDTIVELAHQISSMLESDETLMQYMNDTKTTFIENTDTPNVSLTANNNTDYTLKGTNILLISLSIPSTITKGYAAAFHWTNGESSVPSINITNNTNYNVKYLLNNTPVQSLNLEILGAVVNMLIMLDGDIITIRVEEL